LARAELGQFGDLRGYHPAQVGQRLEFFPFVRIDAEDEDEDDRAEPAANAVEEGEAEDVGLAAADHVSGQDFDGLTRAPRVELASSQKRPGAPGSPLRSGNRIVLSGMRGGSCLSAIWKRRMRVDSSTSA